MNLPFKSCQTVAGISMICQFYNFFFNLIFGSDWRISLILIQISRPTRNFGRYSNQANIQQTSLILPVESYWLISSPYFIMVKSDYRSELCVTIIESIKNVSKLQARATFLQKCHNFKITPTTMTIKPMNFSVVKKL